LTASCEARKQYEKTEDLMDNTVEADIAAVYRRELPGGGYVAIDVMRVREIIRTRVSVERRAADERRDGHQPVVIAESEGDERSAGFTGMYRIAADNAAIARAILELEGPQRAD
jgi:hypothetical protein